MKNRIVELLQVRTIKIIYLIVFMTISGSASLTLAQVPARFYWKTLAGSSGMPLILQSMSGNTNPFDFGRTVLADAEFDATLAMAGYAHTFALFDRAAMAALFLPMGRISGELTVAGRTFNQATSGFGDPMFEFDINLIGPPAQKNIPDMIRYELGFSVDLLADIAVPLGEYQEEQPLNIGQNRWYGRIGAPIIAQIGPWVPGKRTTLELLPAVWLFGSNDDYLGNTTLETDPVYQVDAHLTRDFAEHFWGSLDAAWFNGGKTTMAGFDGKALNNFGLGFTFGYGISDNLNLTVGYKSTVRDSEADDLRMDTFMLTLVYGWHPILEGSSRLREG